MRSSGHIFVLAFVLALVGIGCDPNPPPTKVESPFLNEASLPACADRPGTNEPTTIEIDGRSTILHPPPTYTNKKRVPLVIVMHGLGSQAEDVASPGYGIVEAGVRNGMMTAFPQGFAKSWNAGACCLPSSGSVDDVNFVSKLIDAIAARYCVDPKRVFAMGFSNGGFMAHRLGCELSLKLAAISSVSGVIGVSRCEPARPIPVLQIHGTADTVVPFGGGGFGNFDSVESTVSGWRDRNACGEGRRDTFVDDEPQVRCVAAEGCKENAEVELCTLTNGLHTFGTWGFSAADHTMRFFSRHPMP